MVDERYPSRRKSRKHAVEIGYAALIRGTDPVEILAATAREVGWRQHPWYSFCQQLVIGVSDHETELDEIIAAASERWSLERMGRTDLAILRMAAFELLQRPETPSAVVISEAAAIAEELSAEGSPKFVQGVLSKIAAQRVAPAAEAPAPEAPESEETS